MARWVAVGGCARFWQGAWGGDVGFPPNYGATAWFAEQRQRLDRAAEAVKASGISHVVFLSSVGGQIPEGTGPIRAVRYGEQKLSPVARNLTILRPCYFMENWAPGIGMAKGQGLLPTFMAPQAKGPMIATRDIGRVAAERLMAGGRAVSYTHWTPPKRGQGGSQGGGGG